MVTPAEDVDMLDVAIPQRRFILAVDFGTTFSSVAFMFLHNPETRERHIEPAEIDVVDQYPKGPSEEYLSMREVPTETWYPERPFRISSTQVESMTVEDSEKRGFEEGAGSPVANGSPSDTEDEYRYIEENESDRLLWGFEVQDQLKDPVIQCDEGRRVQRSKLMLDHSQHTLKVRNQLAKRFDDLKKKRLINEPSDVISDFLEKLFIHTREHLEHAYADISDSLIEFVLCVPAIWTAKACRVMQVAMASAIQKSGIANLHSGSIDNLFIVSEPEAAAAVVLDDVHDIQLGETFVLIDAGGGTVDAVTYMVNHSHPLRLEREAVRPGGALCGSNYLNQELEDILLRRLKDETYLERDGKTIKRIVDSKVVEFENGWKRKIDVTNLKGSHAISIDGLQPNPKKGFTSGRLLLNVKEIKQIFLPVFDRVAEVMKNQLTLAKEQGLAIKKIVFVGGFAASWPLKKYLTNFLTHICDPADPPIQILIPKQATTAVARGAVIRALRKQDGPARIIQSSYGFLRTEPWEPEAIDAHKEVEPYYDKIDGERWVKNTIDWLIKKNEMVPRDRAVTIPVSHTFGLKERRFLCEEILYVSDEEQESHYRVTHEKNKGAEKAGRIVVDMTFLRRDGLIKPVVPELGRRGQKHYKVEFDLVMIVDGRNLRYEARHPRGEEGKVQQSGHVCLAAAFVPGTE